MFEKNITSIASFQLV